MIRPCLLVLAAVIAAVAVQPSAIAAEDKADSKKTLAVFTFGGSITEAPTGDDFPFGPQGESFNSLLTRLKKVEKDDSVSGVVILGSGGSLGTSQIEEVRQVLDSIKASGKDVVAYAESLTTRGLLLLSGAGSISVVPTGDIFINGLYGESPYLRRLLNMLDVEPDFSTCGDFKSASEMFMRDGPSPAAQKNRDWLIDGIFDTYLDLISKGRGVSKEKAKDWIDRGMYSAEQAKEAGIIDVVQHRQDFVTGLKKKYGDGVQFDKRYGKKKTAEIDLSSPFGIMKFYADLLSGPKKTKSTKGSVAIVYVEGPILTGSSDPSGFPLGLGGVAYSTPIRKALDKAAADDSVKAVVLRVDSPGGSAVASEIILDATKRVAAKKPLIVSMGNVAGSGGYYVACGTKMIFADASTITGSIGVVGGKLATNGLWQKVGVTWNPTKRGANAGMLSSGDKFSDKQRELMQSWMDEVYEVFKGHVTAIRGDKLKKEIEDLAGGRVFTGRQALELGLIDKIGGLSDSIAFAANEAKLEDYDVRVIPRPKSFIELLMSDLQGDDKDSKTLSLALHKIAPARTSLIEAAIPHLKTLEPQRLQSVLLALTQLLQLQKERVLMAMPIIDIRD